MGNHEIINKFRRFGSEIKKSLLCQIEPLIFTEDVFFNAKQVANRINNYVVGKPGMNNFIGRDPVNILFSIEDVLEACGYDFPPWQREDFLHEFPQENQRVEQCLLTLVKLHILRRLIQESDDYDTTQIIKYQITNLNKLSAYITDQEKTHPGTPR